MDEFDQGGMDPTTKKYFKMIINSLSFGLMWMIFFISVGLYFKLLIPKGGLGWQNWVFYVFSLVSFIALIRYYIKIWSPPLRQEL